jgi:hypothetical protein
MKHPIDIVPSPPALSRPQSESIAGEVVTYDAAQIVRLTAKYLGHEPHGTMRELARLLAIHPRTITRALRACGTDFACQKRLAQRASKAASDVGRSRLGLEISHETRDSHIPTSRCLLVTLGDREDEST